ncbi:MAG TPA: hypothetical protein VKO35_08150, partial [Acidimicrobiia bacterium]|nr:hypothetical protein [Acidimicrobiia bacterium]
RCLRAGWPLPAPAPKALVSYVAAADAAQAFALAAGAPGAVGEAFNVAAADTPAMADFLAGVVAAVGSRSRLVPVPRVMARLGVGAAKVAARLGGGRIMGTPAELLDFALVGGAYSIDKARRLLGYEPEMTCVDAWAATYRWYWEHRPAR